MTYLSAHQIKTAWKKLAEGYEKNWDYPICIEVLVGKYIAIEAPNNTESLYNNCKGFHSLVLMAMCDANYCFSLVAIGGFGRDNDAALFSQSEMGIACHEREIGLPEARTIAGF